MLVRNCGQSATQRSNRSPCFRKSMKNGSWPNGVTGAVASHSTWIRPGGSGRRRCPLSLNAPQPWVVHPEGEQRWCGSVAPFRQIPPIRAGAAITQPPDLGLSTGVHRTTFTSIEAGHPARLEMESSDEKDDPRRADRHESGCRRCQRTVAGTWRPVPSAGQQPKLHGRWWLTPLPRKSHRGRVTPAFLLFGLRLMRGGFGRPPGNRANRRSSRPSLRGKRRHGLLMTLRQVRLRLQAEA